MLVLCPNCRNHYDDEKQVGSDECPGPGTSPRSELINRVGHGFKQPSPIAVHLAAVRGILKKGMYWHE